MIAFLVALCVSWASRTWLVGFWLPLVLDSPSLIDAHVLLQDRAAFERTVTTTTALLLTVPFFSAETWLLICRMTRRDQARRLTVPFSVVSTGSVLLAAWLARQVNLSHFLVPF
jgi:hypothetical protein